MRFRRRHRRRDARTLNLPGDAISRYEGDPMSESITESSGNVFADLGFEPGEAAILQMRARLMNDLRATIESSGMTQTEAAARLGIAQSRVSGLVRGKWDKFSLEMLITLEARAGRRVTLELAA
jgi:predicted XRE-type DNA-binding protein